MIGSMEEQRATLKFVYCLGPVGISTSLHADVLRSWNDGTLSHPNTPTYWRILHTVQSAHSRIGGRSKEAYILIGSKILPPNYHNTDDAFHWIVIWILWTIMIGVWQVSNKPMTNFVVDKPKQGSSFSIPSRAVWGFDESYCQGAL